MENTSSVGNLLYILSCLAIVIILTILITRWIFRIDTIVNYLADQRALQVIQLRLDYIRAQKEGIPDHELQTIFEGLNNKPFTTADNKYSQFKLKELIIKKY